MPDQKILITPSILSANLGKLQQEIDSIEPYADWIQVDVMDGHFVPNLTFGAPVIKCIKTKLPIDIHLMVTNPAARIREFLDAGAKHITFHAEAVLKTEDRRNLISEIRDAGATAGIALNPRSPVSIIEDILPDVDLVLIMSVEPGFSGQRFDESVLSKVSLLRERLPQMMIQMDGGIDDKTAKKGIAAGADNLVSASYIFSAADRAKAISSLRAS